MQQKNPEVEFNQKAHEVIRAMLNKSEDRLISDGTCDPTETEDYLCRHYLAQVASLLGGASYYLPSEAAVGAEIFLSRNCGIYSMGRYARYSKICGKQLSQFTHLYFRRYPETLTQMYIERMQSATDEEIRHLNKDGLVQLAAANLPGVLEQARREQRRRGSAVSTVIVFNDDREHRLQMSKAQLRLTNNVWPT
ncbi:hypothetical protein GGR95_001398 [Sulfitobacter undariae]|uniref:Uncharacterized protein n=1 Tax=Sulfitobacter undariae TaxID=1563671 RepID=A0A7W6H074_9RHOB|nr:hypothetical protein [Sulfitobacter undariae]MBB3993767.1 hypothetical protein [Sulfitobacter undariae]